MKLNLSRNGSVYHSGTATKNEDIGNVQRVGQWGGPLKILLLALLTVLPIPIMTIQAQNDVGREGRVTPAVTVTGIFTDIENNA